jgi:hypothetical protein
VCPLADTVLHTTTRAPLASHDKYGPGGRVAGPGVSCGRPCRTGCKSAPTPRPPGPPPGSLGHEQRKEGASSSSSSSSSPYCHEHREPKAGRLPRTCVEVRTRAFLPRLRTPHQGIPAYVPMLRRINGPVTGARLGMESTGARFLSLPGTNGGATCQPTTRGHRPSTRRPRDQNGERVGTVWDPAFISYTGHHPTPSANAGGSTPIMPLAAPSPDIPRRPAGDPL